MRGPAPQNEEEEVDEQEPRDESENEGGEGSDDDKIQIIEVDDPHMSMEERRKELDGEREDEPLGPSGGLRPEWKEFLAEATDAAARRDANVRCRSRQPASGSTQSRGRGEAPFSKRDVIEILDSSDEERSDEERSDEDRPPLKRLRATMGNADPPKPSTPHARTITSETQASSSRSVTIQDPLHEERVGALGTASTTLSGTSRPSGVRHVSKTTIKLKDGSDGWDCRVCSLNNPISRTRCGELR